MKLIRQRTSDDCGIAALAMIAGVRYADARKALLRFTKTPERGTTNKEVRLGAQWLGTRLTPSRKRQAPRRSAVVSIFWSGARAILSPGGHFVVVQGQKVLDPKAGRFPDLGQYLKKHHARVGTYLERL